MAEQMRSSNDLQHIFGPANSLLQSPREGLPDALHFSVSNGYTRAIEIHLRSHWEFFQMLCSELAALNALQKEQHADLTTQISHLLERLPSVTSPFKKKNDLYTDSELYHDERTVAKSKEQLQWFTLRIEDMSLLAQFKLKQSQDVLEAFVKLNVYLLQSLQFHALNQTATRKILKKFDKHTALAAREEFS
ncbi:SPX domain-containing protein, partial [Lipomyces starkeyi]